MIPEIAEIHQNMIEAYLKSMDATYLGVHKEGLISLKEKLLERVHYVVKLFPALHNEPMMALYIKKISLERDEREQMLLAFTKSGKIVGGDLKTLQTYPQFFSLETQISENIFCLNSGIRFSVN